MALAVTACATQYGNIDHQIETPVVLSRANFKVIGSVTGEATRNYFFNVGGWDQGLYEEAWHNLIKKAHLTGTRAIINVTTDIKGEKAAFWGAKTVYLSGDVIEFYPDPPDANP